jgi:predicted transglutaminase-like cysteine proteinase
MSTILVLNSKAFRGTYKHIAADDPNTTSRGGLAWLLRTIAITILLLLALVHAPRAHADGARPFEAASWLLTADETAQPTAAWSDFCERLPAECVVNPSEPAMIQLTDEVWQTIVKVNRQVNTAVSPREDIDHWGVIDRWDYPDDGFGDCEDYQLLKRRLLVEAGLTGRALRMVVVLDENREGHAVLTAHTDHGDFILDNKSNKVIPWYQTGYVYIKSEGNKSHAWVSLRNQVTATSAFGQ